MNAAKLKDEQVKSTIREKLVDSGEKDRLKVLLQERLVECGWHDNLKAYCKGTPIDNTNNACVGGLCLCVLF